MSRSAVAIIPPGEFLKEELEARGWSQVELAEILDRSPRVISEIVSVKRAISPETAKGLAAAFGTSAEMWMNLESSYQLSKAQFEGSAVTRRAGLYAKFPVKEILRRGWVKPSDDLDVLEKNFLSFFGIKSIEEAPVFFHAAKKTEYKTASDLLQLAWLNRAKQISRASKANDFTVTALKTAINELRACLGSLSAVKKVPVILSKAGVRLVIVEHLPGAKIDGACFWLNRSSPVIALSLRFDRVDNFWHTLFHEMDHILNGEGKENPIIDVLDGESEAKQNDIPPIEIRANKAAANCCIPLQQLDSWLATTSRPSSKRQIISFASQMHVHPGIVVGQLQKRRTIPYSFHRNLLEKVRQLVIDSAVTDGFGKKVVM